MGVLLTEVVQAGDHVETAVEPLFPGEMNCSSWFWLFEAKLPEREMTGAGEKTTSPSSCSFSQSR